jgi:hypothetical protein
VFERILGLPDEDLRCALLEGVCLGTPTAFDVLKQFCYGQVRWDPEGALKVQNQETGTNHASHLQFGSQFRQACTSSGSEIQDRVVLVGFV